MKLRFERWIPVVMVLLAVPFLMAQVVNRPGASGGGGSGASSNYVDTSVQTSSNSLVAQISAGQVWTNAGGSVSLTGVGTALFFPDQKLPRVTMTRGSGLFSFAMTATNSTGDQSTLTMFAGEGNEEIYFQSNLGVPLDLWPSQPDGANDIYLFDTFTTRVNASGSLLTVNNHGTPQFTVGNTKTTNATPLDVAQIISGYSGFASYSTIATNAVTPTGWTNTAGVNVSGYITATAVSFTINDRAGAVLYTSPTLTATLPVSLQNGWSLRAASGLVGTILPW